ncbi:hypothetical protein PENANT_c044G00677 [Penicillium antarcticum]|uniref:Zn(2)-C6 fungal-type domain-containing protein n=1 Tax=Penicillium antarcticum TaxID=416450 RepID=A0A1V6PRX1_9EURO|nr:uncharacterized protein N7508_003988 [Penicillium antarcticum]KAJ5308609.1 hypothetical protein N7508_003988 [Penicillium antarcticum]OQD79780.1 hypothetical protein PENANT_c044G00677 [Penicillium antarcticum]
MPGVPSNKACERCKKRHIKCDETRPHCQRCTTARVECPGYIQTRKFIDQGATVRRRYAPYQESHPKPSSGSHSHRAPAEPTDLMPQNQSQATNEQIQSNYPHEHDGPPLHHQLGETSLDSNDGPMNMEMTGPSNSRSETFPGATQQEDINVSKNPTVSIPTPIFGGDQNTGSAKTIQSPISPMSGTRGLSSFEMAYLGLSNDVPDAQRGITSQPSSHRSEKEEFQDIFSELMTGTEHEIAFLTRHYSEVLGPWLDLTDAQKWFTVYVPIRAINNLSVKYAISALSAKHLARVKGIKSPTGGMYTSPATTEVYPNDTQVDWYLKAANYYYLAASDLNNITSDGYTAVSSSAVLESPCETVGRWLNSRQTRENLKPASDDANDLMLVRKTEELLATSMILTMYRLLDANGDDWHKQLFGIRPMFQSLLDNHLPTSTSFSHGIRAAFWNFARQDYLGSYFTRSPTHFNPEDHSLWCTAGISINEKNELNVIPNGSSSFTQEDQAANGLIWLVSKVINFLAKSKESQIAQWTGSPPGTSPGAQGTSNGSQSPYPDTSTWLKLSFEFQTWFDGVPETFRPSVRIEHPKDLSRPEGPQLPFPEIFHGLTTCAATIQHYHFGRIALLLNRPADILSAPSTAFDRLQGYREVTKEVEFRSREVCGLALGRPQGCVRIFMIPLLYAVGQCLESPEEHQIIIDLLRGVEADLGWATEYAVQKLQASWNQ